AVQDVVVEALIVRLVRSACDRTLLARFVDREAAAAVAAAVGHVGVGRKRVPAVGEGGPVGERTETAQPRAHVRGFDEGVARAGDGIANTRGVLQAGSDFAHEPSLSLGWPAAT